MKMNEVFMIISKEDALKKLAEITGKGIIYVESERNNASSDFDNNQEKIVVNATEIERNTAERHATISTSNSSSSLDDLRNIFGGIVVNKYLMECRQMTKKEYLFYTKGIKQSDLLDHPLLYAMFRAEDQAEVNFFEWINRFKK